MTRRIVTLEAIGAALAAAAALMLARAGASLPGSAIEAGRPPRLHPDYAGVTLPPNIAPLNFVVDEPAERVVAKVSGERGPAFTVAGRGGSLRMPVGRWRALLAANRGGDIFFDVYARQGGKWSHFERIRNRVAPDPIDGTLVYRFFQPAYNAHVPMAIFQRDLTGFAERPIISDEKIGHECLNCHTFLDRHPDTFFFHIRSVSGSSAMVLARGGKARAVDTRTPQRRSPAAYASWHPNGKVIAFSFNRIRQYFHETGAQPKDALDAASGLGLYWVESGKTETPAALNQPGRLPTFPCWAPDGSALYFCSAPRLWPATNEMPVAYQKQVRYDLVRAPFDPKSATFGVPETVLSAKETGKSLLQPRLSPDGRFLLFCECEYGSFPVFQRQSDLYLLDLRSKERRPVCLEPAPTSRRDSWHCWSTNGRWIVFSSKRDNGLVARPYIRYLDGDGRPAKAFVLPQQDPTFYDRCLSTFNLPELVSGPITVPAAELARAANSSPGWAPAGPVSGGARQP